MVWYGNYGFGVAEEKSPLAKKAAEQFRFYTFCDYLENHPNLTKQDFDALLNEFYWFVDLQIEEDDNFSAYPIVRLLIPAKDQRKRLTVKMLRTAIELFTHDAQVPKYQTADQFSDFVIERRNNETSDLSIYEVNAFLKKMAAEPSQRNHIIRECVDRMGAIELKWFFRILFQEISDKACGSTTGRGLINLTNYLSKKADKLLQSGMDLESICVGVFLAIHRNIDLTNALILGKPVRPMLLSRVGCNVEDLFTVIKNCRRPFYVETKYDGEHFLLHRLDDGKEYKFFSRRGLEHSDESDENSLAVFARKLHRHFKSSVKDCILDGELVVKDLKTNRIVGKNMENEEGIVFDVKRMKESNRYKRVFVVFDLIFLNSRDYFEEPLTQRLQALDSLIFQSTDPNAVFISEKKEMSKMKDFQDFYYSSLRSGEEGVVIKGKNSLYNFGQRAASNGWFKVKPDYGPRSVIDVAVVGVRHENKDLSSRIKSFEVATLAGGSERGSRQFRILGGVQSRLKKHDFERLLRALKLGDSKRPAWIQGISHERNVRYTDVDHLPVVEVKASGVINNKLQFPVISAIRLDKSPDEVCEWNDIAAYGKKLRSRKRIFEPSNTTYTVKGKKMKREILNSSVHQTPRRVNRNTVLKGVKVFVIPEAKREQKEEFSNCEKKLVEFGIELFKNDSPKIELAVSPNEKGIRTKGVIKKGQVYVISMAWVLRCISANKVLRWNEDEIVHDPKNERAFSLLELNEDEPEPRIEEEMEEQPQASPTRDLKREPADAQEPEPVEPEPVEAEPVEPEHFEVSGAQIGEEVDQQAEHDAMEIDHPSENNSQASVRTAATMNSHGTLGMEDLQIEEEDERQQRAQTQQFDEEEFELPADLFFGFNFSVPGHKIDTVDAEYKEKIQKCGGRIMDDLDASITHIFFQDKYDFDEDPLGVNKWLNENQWMAILVNRKWIDKAIRDDDRYLDSVPAIDLN